jgi:hypothetical protein
VRDALKTCGRPACLKSLVPGANLSWDNCCGCEVEGEGQLWVRVISMTPMPTPSQPADVTDLMVRVGVGVVRCMHGLTEESTPTAEQMNDDALGMTADADIMLHALKAWTGTQYVIPKSRTIASGTPLGPDGFCGGFEWQYTFRILLCQGC